jgi:glycosyltransferase involved in cell wall biosynthesis
MKELKIILDDSTGLYIAWEKSPVTTKYVVMGKDNTFNDSILCETTDSKIFIKNDNLKGVVGVSVEYIFKDDDSNEEIVIDRTNAYIRKLNAYKVMNIKSIESCFGITFSYATSTIYDRYFIYEKTNDKWNKIIETEDFQITSPKFKVGNTYYIEAYSKEKDGSYKMKCKSFEYVCEPINYNPTFIEPKVSVIIPTYNCCKFLARAIDSLILSSLEEKEIIIINDGSKDKTKEVLDWYKRKYPTIIKAFHKENEGTVAARNFGIEHATAEYSYYMDHDDYVHPEMLKNMYEAITRENADFVMNKTIVKENIDNTSIFYKAIDDPTNEKRCLIKTYEDFIMDKHNSSGECFYLVTLWQHMTKTKLYKEHKMPNFIKYEDVAYVRSLFSYGEKFVFQMDSYYVWDKRLKNTVGTSSTKTEKNLTSEEKAKLYIDSLFYFLNDYNESKKDYLIYDALCDLQSYCGITVNAVFKDHYTYNRDNLYMEYAYNYLLELDVLNNPLVQKDINLYRTCKGVLMIMEDALKREKK